jgi:deoxyribodipyrimidine photo-lyase
MTAASQKIIIFWFRRDLRLEDNHGLFQALQAGLPVLPVFIFDRDILDHLRQKNDPRVEFIHRSLLEINTVLQKHNSGLLVKYGRPLEVWNEWLHRFDIHTVYTNHDYEPYASKRDEQIELLLQKNGIRFLSFKDQVIFEKNEIVKKDSRPYTVYTPYRRRWQSLLESGQLSPFPVLKSANRFIKQQDFAFPGLDELGFQERLLRVPSRQVDESIIRNYEQTRDFPGLEGTTRLSVHLRFGTVSIRKLVRLALELNETWLGELIWREFFMMILHHFPHVVDQPFKSRYAHIPWRNDRKEFERWCTGHTGYPLVDAGIRELNETGFMHNRVRMVTASFLTRHLLTDWRWGERYFAEKLLDYELSSNNGNWQWVAGCGCDAVPYFRIFNPETQQQKFDPEFLYIKKWLPEFNTRSYPRPIVDHTFARKRALAAFDQIKF